MEMLNKVAAGIVTFNPSIERLKENIDGIVHQVAHVYIFDNGSGSDVPLEKIVAKYDAKISVIYGGENRGIAFALNRLCERAILDGYKWLLTLDQDSVCPSDLVTRLLPYAGKDVAIVGPQIVYRDNEEFTRLENKPYRYVEWVITSASLTNLEVFAKVHGFDEWLFIDWVDYDYCIRARGMGYKVIQVYTIQIMHELGKLRCRKIFGKSIFVTNHASFRYYYMARNSLYLGVKLSSKSMYWFLIKLFGKVLLWESNKIEKLRFMFSGVNDYCKWRTGE